MPLRSRRVVDHHRIKNTADRPAGAFTLKSQQGASQRFLDASERPTNKIEAPVERPHKKLQVASSGDETAAPCTSDELGSDFSGTAANDSDCGSGDDQWPSRSDLDERSHRQLQGLASGPEQHAAVARSVPRSELRAEAKAQAAMKKEWGNLWGQKSQG